MNAASHTPSAVFTCTSVSTTGRSAADADPAATARPAATDIVTNSRRESSLGTSPVGFSDILSSCIFLLPVERTRSYTPLSNRASVWLFPDRLRPEAISHGARRSTQCRHAAARNLADSL